MFIILHIILNFIVGIQESKITNSIDYYFCKHNVSFNTIESEGFRHMLKTLCPLYNPPNHDTIARRINETYTVTSNEVKETISIVNSTLCSSNYRCMDRNNEYEKLSRHNYTFH